MRGVRVIVDGQLVAWPPQGRRRAMVDIDEHGNVEVVINTASGPPPSIPPDVRTRMRRMREDGATLSEIARCLNEEGVPTARGGLWRHSTVAYALKARKRP